MKEFWNQRYSAPEYAYGDQPNEFFREQLAGLSPGKILFPLEGEGRNAVHAAMMGWTVEAFDQSEEGRKKAFRLAEKQQVTINYQIGLMEDMLYPEGHFDAVALIFAHFSPEVRTRYHHKVVSWIKPGGTLILEGFGKDQIRFVSGGPRDPAMLFSKEELEHDFSGLAVQLLTEKEVILDEGLFHQGPAAVIQMKAQRLGGFGEGEIA